MLGIDRTTNRNTVELLYIYPGRHGKGLGHAIWQSIEAMYPETEVWELVTPYFEKRNIHFYVNKCGFSIVEFFNGHHKSPYFGDDEPDYRKEYFRFEKRMKPAGEKPEKPQ